MYLVDVEILTLPVMWLLFCFCTGVLMGPHYTGKPLTKSLHKHICQTSNSPPV